jgi:hypothetical protein
MLNKTRWLLAHHTRHWLLQATALRSMYQKQGVTIAMVPSGAPGANHLHRLSSPVTGLLSFIAGHRLNIRVPEERVTIAMAPAGQMPTIFLFAAYNVQANGLHAHHTSYCLLLQATASRSMYPRRV